MISYRDLIKVFKQLDLDTHSRVITHVSLEALGGVQGGAETVVGALQSSVEALVMPAFTRRTMVVPPVGPPDNGLEYGTDLEANLEAEVFHYDMPVDEALGPTPEVFRHQAETHRSGHPILSFSAQAADEALNIQTLEHPLAPIQWLADYDADVLLIGADHRSNVSLHWAEQLADRKTFVRWALTGAGVVECSNMPGCSEGFNMIVGRLQGVARRATLGQGRVEAVALRDLLQIAANWIREDPRALLCERTGCPHCSVIRARVRNSKTRQSE
ncbi:MAG: AAC(3) family N-acetyltransferase [Anaerolineales bacterium]|jgi:aminoglycoside 3-N-acetyltransferase